MAEANCVVIIGMAASGKSTIGRTLAEAMGMAHVDTDALIESTYGMRLQAIADALGKETFLDVESAVVSSANVRRVVLSTGGSVIYREQTMRHLSTLGPILHLDVPLPIILERIARKPDRGLAIAPGQTIEDLFAERDALYRKWAECSLQTGSFSVAESTQAALDYLRASHPELFTPADN